MLKAQAGTGHFGKTTPGFPARWSPGAVVRGWGLGGARVLREHGERKAKALPGRGSGPRLDGLGSVGTIVGAPDSVTSPVMDS